jgi:hypothetical protein
VDTRQTYKFYFFKKMSLPSVENRTLGKPPDAVWATFVCRVSPSVKWTLGKGFAECPKKDTRQSLLCRHFFAVSALPSVALGKRFAECFLPFAECLKH